MMTGLILAEGLPEEVALTLAALVPAVVEGLLGDAVVIARQPHPAVAMIAEIAGASLAVAPGKADPWQAGASLARREWLLCLKSGDVPGEGWMRAVDRFLAAAVRQGQPLGRFSRTGLDAAAAFSRLSEGVAGTRTVRAGDVVQRGWLAARDGARVRPVRIAARIERDTGR
jgi:hypothetical protein